MTDEDGLIYNSENSELALALASVERIGDYHVRGRLVAPPPWLQVDGVGTIAFPVQEAQVGSLVGAAERAPYGRGPETVLDTSVRDCWQIGAEKVLLRSPVWQETLQSILARVSEGLGYPADRLEARLYKLLVYERGGFFAPHRDSEKTDGMVGTLVVSLPAEGSGGELVVRHKAAEAVIDLAAEDPAELLYAAFFADCEHETLPVREGSRVSLVYNLVLQGSDSAFFARAPDHCKRVEEISGLLGGWGRAASPEADKIVWLLEHDYSEAGLSFATLKGVDAEVGRVLRDAAEIAHCALHAATVHITEEGQPHDKAGYEVYELYGLEHYTEDDFSMGEVFEINRTLGMLVTPDGEKPDFGRLELRDGEVMPDGALDNTPPDRQKIHEASGNEGVTLEHVYRRAALVVWPRARTVKVLTHGDFERAVQYARAEIARIGDLPGATGRKTELASQLIDGWPPSGFGSWHSTNTVRLKMYEFLRTVGSGPTTERFLRDVVTPAYQGGPLDELVGVAQEWGAETMRGCLLELVKEKLPQYSAAVLKLIRQIFEQDEARKDDHWAGTLTAVSRAALSALPAVFTPDHKGGSLGRIHRGPRTLDAHAIRDLFLVAWNLGLDREAVVAVQAIVEHPAGATPERSLPGALGRLSHASESFMGLEGYQTLWKHASASLLARSGGPPEDPSDWVVDAPIHCQCKDCQQVRAFCADPVKKTVQFSVAKYRRRHIRGIINRYSLEISYETKRQGNPYKLVCTKNKSKHQERIKQYSDDIAHMRMLVASAPGSKRQDACDEFLGRLRNAILLAG